MEIAVIALAATAYTLPAVGGVALAPPLFARPHACAAQSLRPPVMLAKAKKRKKKGGPPAAPSGPSADVPFPLLVPDEPGFPTADISAPPMSFSPPAGLEVGEQAPRPDFGLLAEAARMDESYPPAGSLPSQDEYDRRAVPKPPPTTGEYVSKLPSINAGKPDYYEVDDGKSPFERLVTKITWIGIFTLVGIEIFINTPAFQQIKAPINRFFAGE